MGTITILKANPKPMSSILSRFLLWVLIGTVIGKIALINANPGRNNMKGSPKAFLRYDSELVPSFIVKTDIVAAIESPIIIQYQRACKEKTNFLVETGMQDSGFVKCRSPSFSSSKRVGVANFGFML
jgi:hypothetical protein